MYNMYDEYLEEIFMYFTVCFHLFLQTGPEALLYIDMKGERRMEETVLPSRGIRDGPVPAKAQ